MSSRGEGRPPPAASPQKGAQIGSQTLKAGSKAQVFYEFGPFRLDPARRLLLRDGQPVALTPKAFDILLALIETRGRVLEKDELMRLVWPDTVVEEANLTQNVFTLRKVLGEGPDDHRYIATIPRRGYQFVAEVRETMSGPAGAEPVGPTRAVKGRSLAITAGIAGLAVVVGYFWWQRARAPAPQPSRKIMLAVLPFDNLSADPGQEYFSDGMTEEMITQLGRLQPQRLGVIARTSAMRYKATNKDVKQIGQELDVDYLLEGSVRREADRVRVNAQLIQVSDQTHLWAESYQRELRGILSLEDEVARTVAHEIGLKLKATGDPRRLTGRKQVAPQAYEAYLKGRHAWATRDRLALESALAFFQTAVDSDRGFAPAYAGLADTYSLLGAAGYDVLPTAEAMEKARAAAQSALDLDDTLAEAHASLAFVNYAYDWDWAAGEREFRRAIELNPAYPTAHQWYSEYLVAMGRTDEALTEGRAALALDPLSPVISENLARPEYFARQFDRAIERSRKSLEIDPDFSIAHLRLGRAYAGKGVYAEAVAEFQKFDALSGDHTLALASIANALARSGDRPAALRALADLQALAKRQRVPSYQLALVHVGLGRADEACSWLERSYEERSDFLVYLRVEPLFDPLRSNLRFEHLLHRMGLQP